MRIHRAISAVLVLKHLRRKKSLEVFLRLLQGKYGILTTITRLLDSVVAGACVSQHLRLGSIHCDCGDTDMLRD